MSKFYLINKSFTLLLLLISTYTFAQQTITGKVTSEGNTEMLPGVSIVEKGTTNGTVTDVQGNYIIKVGANASLIFSYIGYENQEVAVDGRSAIDIILVPDLKTLSEVVVVGYGSATKRELTGAVTQISSRNIEKLPLVNFSNALQGRTPGVVVTTTSGDPGQTPTLRIRGASSITSGNNPLFILDGVVVGDINVLNVSDIESFTVLKDASATAIYGSRAANGVVIVTTKKGKKNSFNVDANAFWSLNNPGRKIDLLSPAEFAEQANIKSVAQGGNQIISDQELTALRNGAGTDWQEEALKENVWNKNYSLSVSGGTDKTRFYVSGNFLDRSAIIKSANYERYGFRANVSSEVGKYLEIGSNISLNKETTTGALTQLDNVLTFDPTISYRQENGNYQLTSPRGLGNINRNALINANEQANVGDSRKILANAYFSIKLLKNLTWRTTGGTEVFNGLFKFYNPSISGNTPSVNWSDNQNTRFNLINQLTYELTLGQLHDLKIDAVQEYQTLRIQSVNTFGSGLISETLKENSLAYAPKPVVTTSGWKEMISSYMLRANYSFNNKYNLTVTGRYDGSSNFNSDNRWGFFPSVGASWILSEESFLNSGKTLSYLKLRGSYGLTGNQNIGDPASTAVGFYTSRPTDAKGDWPPADFSYPISNGEPVKGFVPTLSSRSKGLSWETNTQFDAGVDAEFFNGRITASVDYYHKKSEDLLLVRQLPSYAGVTSILGNVGAIENKGVEIVLGVNSGPEGDFGWNINGNLSFNRNKVLDLGTSLDPISGQEVPTKNTTSYSTSFYTGIGGDIATILEVGKPLGQFYGVAFEGIYQENEAEVATSYGLKPGDPKYTDLNKDGKIDEKDKQIIGNANPKLTWGLTGGANYRNFDLNIVVYGKVGGDIYNLSKGVRMGYTLETAQATDRDILNRWTPQNPSNKISGYTGSVGANRLMSGQNVEKGSFTRIKDITLGYTLPETITSKARLQKIRFYVSGNNLFTITKFKGYDPEISSHANPSSPRDLEMGVHAQGLVPLPKSYVLGLSATF